MAVTNQVMKMPELLVFVRALAVGFITAEVWGSAYYLGTPIISILTGIPVVVIFGLVFSGAALCVVYAIERGAHLALKRMIGSFRVDLIIAAGIGAYANLLIGTSAWIIPVHDALKKASPYSSLSVFILLCTVLLSPLIRKLFTKSKSPDSPLYFFTDEEIETDTDDLLESKAQAESFAKAVLESSTHPGLIFGVDGPWGVGKTSFINLAQRHWEQAKEKVIVCRFEPLRYASESDLADRLIRDLSAAIQRRTFAPEFRPAASRYSRLIKGKTDLSFLGFKVTLEPGQETVEDLLEDIDDVLKRIDHRVIIVIDDLDRLDAKTINSVLFATRQTLKLSQATYVLCYDTEMLVLGKDEDSRAREFLEKFVSVKLSLFVDSAKIRDFLRRDWQHAESKMASIPSDTMFKLGSVLSALADLLDGDQAANYIPLIGNLRKVKRFVNSILLMQLDKTDLGRTDFDKRDLINLILLNLNFPGLFRRIYAEETEGRSGTFSVRRADGERKFINVPEFSSVVEQQPKGAQFLLKNIFDVRTFGVGIFDSVNEAVLASRACFNQGDFRNLEGYLKLIVRFSVPDPRGTFILYQTAVNKVQAGNSVASVLNGSDFQSEYAQDQFWRVLVNESRSFNSSAAEDSINTLIEYLPLYPAISNIDRPLRQRSIYSLLRLLDNAGWGRTSSRRRSNSAENVVEVAYRIFGENVHEGKGLLLRLIAEDRGVLGWNDLMVFRLQCSADRGGQLFNLQSALVVHQDINAVTSGLTSALALVGMRKLSQEVFALFKRTYIEPRRNFFAEVDNALDKEFVGHEFPKAVRQEPISVQPNRRLASVVDQISAERTSIKTFVIYQLSNPFPPTGSGVGCGYYDESGNEDGKAIARLMNNYVFDFCFNPKLGERNVFHFLDFCLANLTHSFFNNGDDHGYVATAAGISSGLDPIEMGRYWDQHRDHIRQQALHLEERTVVTSGYTASYRGNLAEVFAVLDDLANSWRLGRSESQDSEMTS